ncbi:MAG: FAD-dependent oxidoreductase [bacterium]|nr:FAD-dependent oxidoreductase [bacterium]
MNEFEYGIIGGGPAGYTCGIELAMKGHSVVLFEKDKIGGTCLNKGCIPTKSLLHISESYKQATKAFDYGINLEVQGIDFAKINEYKNKVVQKIGKSLEAAVKNSGVNIVYANASIKDNHTIIADNSEYKVENIIFAGGAKPKSIKGLEYDGNFVLNSDDVLNLESLPKSVLIIGSGAIGIEWARIFSNFGVNVIITELAPHLCPMADIDISKRVERIFKQNKINYYLNTFVETFENKQVILSNGQKITVDFILIACGREPIKPKFNNLTVLGDSCGEVQLAHFAIHQAKAYVSNENFDKTLVPSVIYGSPEIAWVGMRGQDCDENCSSSMLPIAFLGKAWCDDSTDGFIKLIVKDGKIKGASIISNEASALIHEVLIAIQNNLTIDDLKQVCFAHPTYSEGIYEVTCRL